MGFFSKIKEAIVGNSAKQNEKYVAGLDKSGSSLSSKINELAARYREIDDDYFEELENILIMSDVGVSMVMTIVDEIKKEVRLQNIKDPQMINDIIVDKMFVIYANDSYMTTKINYDDNDLTVILMVGVNGAGKTTLIRLLTGLNFKSEGEIILFGHNDNLQYERSKIGCTIEMPALYKDMTASQNLEVQRIQRGIPNKSCIADTLELIGLSNAGKKRVANFSLGMKQRLALGVALLGEPEFLILDEPVNGLDPTGIIELRELLKKLVKERETTILISSHILSELHQLATCYGFLHKGELLKQISAEKLNEECKRHICLKTDNIQKTTLILEQKANIKNYSVYPDNSIRIYDCLDNVRMISKLLTDNEIIIDEISVQGEDLETYFENLIGGRKNV